MKHLSVFLGTVLTFGLVVARAGDVESPVIPEEPIESSAVDSWEFGFRPYLWMTGLEGTLGVNGVYAPVDIDFGDIWENLDIAWSSTLEARKGKWGVMLDFTYLDMSDDYLPSYPAPPAPQIAPSGWEVEMFLVDLVGSYRALEWEKGFLDLTGGVRWMSVDTSIRVSQASGGGFGLGVRDDWFDPHIGLRAEQALSDRFYLRGFADVGGFGVGSDLTVQVLAGVGYQVSEKVALELAYRYLKEDYDNAPGLTFDTEMSGPILGLSITW